MTNFQRGYGECDIGTGGPTIGPRFAADYAVEEPEKVTKHDANRKARRAFLYAAVIFGALGFAAGKAWAEGETVYALRMQMTPAEGGAWVTFGAGVLATPELCAMAGRGIVAEVTAEVPELVMQFTCIPVPVGASA